MSKHIHIHLYRTADADGPGRRPRENESPKPFALDIDGGGSAWPGDRRRLGHEVPAVRPLGRAGHHLIEEQARRTPDATAIIAGIDSRSPRDARR